MAPWMRVGLKLSGRSLSLNLSKKNIYIMRGSKKRVLAHILLLGVLSGMLSQHHTFSHHFISFLEASELHSACQSLHRHCLRLKPHNSLGLVQNQVHFFQLYCTFCICIAYCGHIHKVIPNYILQSSNVCMWLSNHQNSVIVAVLNEWIRWLSFANNIWIHVSQLPHFWKYAT